MMRYKQMFNFIFVYYMTRDKILCRKILVSTERLTNSETPQSILAHVTIRGALRLQLVRIMNVYVILLEQAYK